MKKLFVIASALLLITACSAEVGSDAWCADMKEKPKADWSSNEAGSFAKHCVFK
jgi:hypothetical protein